MERVFASNAWLQDSGYGLVMSLPQVDLRADVSWKGYRMAKFACLELVALHVACPDSSSSSEWGSLQNVLLAVLIAVLVTLLLMLSVTVCMLRRWRISDKYRASNMNASSAIQATSSMEEGELKTQPVGLSTGHSISLRGGTANRPPVAVSCQTEDCPAKGGEKARHICVGGYAIEMPPLQEDCLAPSEQGGESQHSYSRTIGVNQQSKRHAASLCRSLPLTLDPDETEGYNLNDKNQLLVDFATGKRFVKSHVRLPSSCFLFTMCRT